MKIGLFTDFHWGINKNNSDKVAVGEEVMRKFSERMVKAGVSSVIFMGDWNHSRDFLHVNTQERARKALETFASKFDQVFFIIGNHDCHFKDHNDVNSVEQFSRIPNVQVFKTYEEIVLGGRKFGLCPWGTLPPKQNDLDAAFGHFEFSGAALVGAVSTGPYTMEDVTRLCPLVFSGHFHIHKHYETTSGKVITAGCPYEQDWGDVGNKKGFYIIDTEDMSYQFTENDFSPRHVPIRWSQIKKMDTNHIDNNYIRIVVDSEYDYDNVVKVCQALSLKGARSVETDYQFQKELSIIQSALGDVSLVSHEEAINKFIDGLDIDDAEKDMIRPIAISMFKEKNE